MAAALDLTGQRFGRLIAKNIHDRDKWGAIRWYCECDCGGNSISIAKNLKNGNTTSCGCYNKELITKHGLSLTPEYDAWQKAVRRCYNENDPEYENYGARGITVCDRWQEPDGQGVINFYNDMGQRPSKDHSLHRINNDEPYCPENCEWALETTQQRNRRNNVVNEQIVKAIRWDREVNKLRYIDLVEKYKLKLKQIERICTYRIWKDISILDAKIDFGII